jgi:hypothetical protein
MHFIGFIDVSYENHTCLAIQYILILLVEQMMYN